jgi:hypothetical protein
MSRRLTCSPGSPVLQAYTASEDFTGAAEVWDCIGDAGSERFSLADMARAVNERVRV